MARRIYYSARKGSHPSGGDLSLPILKRLFVSLFRQFREQERFQEFLGKDCVDDPETYGTAGQDVDAYFLRKLRKENLWPMEERIAEYSEDDLFDVIEVLYDNVSLGVSGRMHSYAGCGMHYDIFDPEEGQAEFRTALNELLIDYAPGFEITRDGEIVHVAEEGFESLFNAPIPHADGVNVTQRIEAAVRRYRSRSSHVDDRREAVRMLIDVLEYLRPQVKDVFASRDEADLFNIANNFGLRHHNERQRTDYDPNIWTRWMFYFYLATVHAALRLLQRKPET